MINYSNISKGIEYYSKCDFKYIEVPWIVSEKVSNVTRPEGSNNIYISGYEHLKGLSCLPASGEQSFLQLVEKQTIKPGKYQTVTPCFRNENTVWNHPHFLKLELFVYEVNYLTVSVNNLVEICSKFFNSLGIETKILETGKNTFDIMSKSDIELGSYGGRYWLEQNVYWLYATGIAEPRTSMVIEMETSQELCSTCHKKKYINPFCSNGFHVEF